MNMCTPPFSYPELKETDPGSFRLVTLLPGTFHDPLICNLTQDTWQKEGIKYEALSYAWGDGSTKKSIQRNGDLFLVTSNLHSALSHLRDREEPRTLWIDAICINQESIQERNHQVQFMGEIYRNAKRVVAWLGEANDDSDDAIFFIISLHSLLVGISNPHSIRNKGSDWLEIPTVVDYVHPHFIHLWQSVCRLLQREWWQRAWIVQEFINGQQVTFQIGSKRLDPTQLAAFITFIQTARVELPWLDLQVAFASGALIDANDLMLGRRIRGKRDLWSLLKAQRHRQCSNPLDKIFSILSLVKRPFPDVFTPDYLKAVHWTFGMVVKTYIETHKDLDILLENMSSSTSKLCPSWCPDWTVAQSRLTLDGQLRRVKTTNTRFSEDMQTLFLDQSVIVDEVARVNVQESEDEFQWEYVDGIAVCNWDLPAIGRTLEPIMGGYGNYDRRVQRVMESLLYTLVTDSMMKDAVITKMAGLGLDSIYVGEQQKAAYFQHVRNQTWGRTILVSKKGMIGLGPQDTQQGDLVLVINGCSAPVILRKREDGSYIWVGDAYFRDIKSTSDCPYIEIMIR